MPALTTTLAIITALVCGVLAGWSLAHLRLQLAGSEKRLGELEKTIQTLQAAQAKHLPYKTADEIENATAALLKLKFESDFRGELIENALSHLQVARNGNSKK